MRKVLKVVAVAAIIAVAAGYFSHDKSYTVITPGQLTVDIRPPRDVRSNVFRTERVVIESPDIRVQREAVGPVIRYAAAQSIQVNTWSKLALTVSLVGTVLILFLFSLAAFWKLMFGGGRRSSNWDANESQILQELHTGFGRMESRVEALETILLERASRESVRS